MRVCVSSLAGPSTDERSWPRSQGQLLRRLHCGLVQGRGAESHVCTLHRDGVRRSGPPSARYPEVTVKLCSLGSLAAFWLWFRANHFIPVGVVPSRHVTLP